MDKEAKAAFKASEKEIEKLKIKIKILEHGFVKNNMALFEEEKDQADLAALED